MKSEIKHFLFRTRLLRGARVPHDLFIGLCITGSLARSLSRSISPQRNVIFVGLFISAIVCRVSVRAEHSRQSVRSARCD